MKAMEHGDKPTYSHFLIYTTQEGGNFKVKKAHSLDDVNRLIRETNCHSWWRAKVTEMEER